MSSQNSTQISNNLEHFDITKKLSSSKYSVYKALDKNTDQEVAVKFFSYNDRLDKNYCNEKSILAKLNHPNIIKMTESSDQVNTTLDRKDQTVSYICFDYASNGDLFEVVSNYGKMSEILTRTLFHSLIDAVSHMHLNNFAHLDLKLENLLFDSKFNLKLTDFDLSQPLDSSRLIARGTAGYRAPEVKKGICYNLKAADIYSLGIVLFIMLSGSPPYAEVDKGLGASFDAFYRMMRKNNKRFWELHATYKNEANLYSEDFKELVNSMLSEEPHQRPTIEEIKNSKWFQGATLDQEDFQREVKRYMQ